MKRDRTEPVGPLVLIEEAVHIMRTAPAAVLAPYYIGSLPLVLAVLFFWTDMSHGAFAESRLVPGALAVAAAFVWMKAFHAMYARAVHDFITGAPLAAWSFRRFARLAAVQGYHHAIGLIVVPLSFIVILPFPWVFAYYQNLTALGDLESVEPGQLTAEARRQAPAWPLQNIAIMWLLSPFLLMAGLILYAAIVPIISAVGSDWAEALVAMYTGMFFLAVLPLSPLGAIIAVNLNMAVSVLPMLANMWLGVETPFTQAIMRNNTTTWAIVCGLAFLIMDPTMKAAYTLRCFYSQSRRTGVDIEVGLRRIRIRPVARLLLIAACLAFGSAAFAQESRSGGLDTTMLDSAIQETLQEREYSWRLPREYDMENPVANHLSDVFSRVARWIVQAMRSFFEWLEPLFEWLRSLFGERGGGNRISGGITATSVRIALLGVAGMLAIGLGVYLLRRWYTGRELTAEPEFVAAPPDLEDENVTANALPEDQWLALAEELLSKSDYRLAVRAIFLAALARLGEQGLVNLARYKSNHDYARELGRRAHAAPEHVSSFNTMVRAFERVWYGDHLASNEMVAQFRKHHESVSARV